MSRTEHVHFAKADIEEVLKFVAKLRLVGGFYIGNIGEQTFRWLPDGSAEVLTKHEPATTLEVLNAKG